MEENIIQSNDATKLVTDYYRDYAIYVNCTRALPGIYDGLKDVQRRIIFATSKFTEITKSAELEGAVMSYHPHGGCYGSLVGLASPINNLPLYDIQGNFGGWDTGAAASRYTACKLSKIARFMYCQFMDYAPMIIGEIGKREPKYLPCLIPYSLIEDTDGIGVGLKSDGIPLDLIDLIDFYIDYIKNKEFDMSKIPRPEFRSSIIDMEDTEWKSEVLSYKGSIPIHAMITQESEKVFVIESLYGLSINSVLKRLKWYLDRDLVDFRDETSKSQRYVFEVIDKSVDIDEFKKYLEKAVRKKVSFNRLMTKDNVSIYCNLMYVIKNSLKALNEAIDLKFDTEKKNLINRSRLLLALKYYKSNTSVFEDLSNKSSDELVSEMMTYSSKAKELNIDNELCYEILKKPISYLTRDHDNELKDIDNKLSEIENHNRDEYLIDLYTKLKDMVYDLYNSRKHTITQSSIISNPRARLENNGNECNLIVKGSGRGVKFNNAVFLIGESSTIYKKIVSASSESSISLADINDNIIAVCSDRDAYIELICNDNTRLVFDTSSYKYDKKIINLYDEQKVVKCNTYTSKNFPDDMKYLIKSRMSRSLR